MYVHFNIVVCSYFCILKTSQLLITCNPHFSYISDGFVVLHLRVISDLEISSRRIIFSF
jgi:hypothetical protein